MRNSRVVVMEKHDERCMRIVILHVRGGSGLISISCDYYDQTLNFLF
jgi:hypothetical protein